MRENSKEQDGKKAARKRLCGESRRFMVNSSVEIESRRDSRFVLLCPISYSCACDHRRSTSTYFILPLGTLKRVAALAIDTLR